MVIKYINFTMLLKFIAAIFFVKWNYLNIYVIGYNKELRTLLM